MRLKDYLSKYNIKREEFATAIGVTQGYVSMLCNGKNQPSLRLVVKIEEVTNGEVVAKDLLLEQGMAA